MAPATIISKKFKTQFPFHRSSKKTSWLKMIFSFVKNNEYNPDKSIPFLPIPYLDIPRVNNVNHIISGKDR